MFRNYGLDLARTFAAYLVVAGHLVFGATLAIGRPYSDWIDIDEKLPLLTKEGNWLWQFDNFLISNYGTALAIIGVSLFFLISGWLMPPMLEKYSRATFLANRFLRIFPMLVFAVLLSAAIQYFLGNRSTLDLASAIATATLTNHIFGKELSLGVVWTLIIEFEFYILLATLGVITQRKNYRNMLGDSAFLDGIFFLGYKNEICISGSLLHNLYVDRVKCEISI